MYLLLISWVFLDRKISLMILLSKLENLNKNYDYWDFPGGPVVAAAAAAAKSLQSCPTLCDPIDRSPSGSPVPGILQARTLEWVAIAFSNA